MAPIRLRHIHIPSSSADGRFPNYKTAAAVQELLRRRLLDFKDAEAVSSHTRRAPNPTLISFTPQPTYTLGRRQASQSSSLSTSDIARLKAPLHIPSHSKDLPALGNVPLKDDNATPDDRFIFNPTVLTSPRGGLATYHGPGQVVLWPVMAINSPTPSSLGYKPFTVRCYSRLLESTTIALLRRLFGLSAFTTEDPGVWVGEGPQVRKIAALGIHLRRHVSSLGAAVNLDMPIIQGGCGGGGGGGGGSPRVEDEQVNPWARFVACGLEGKGVTCVEQELRTAGEKGVGGIEGEIVARAWAEELAVRMELDPRSVEFVKQDEVDEIIGLAEREGWVDVVARDAV
ncbi:hypothetical protein N0V93_009172 [Gnomoniopsis smithogilvyi]|uniref:BPL/LPL catalytic domain-containing protein n=1 Tax=Gnomoniopsis smithogilvyi TaxID=1191159 RepID=A0A9W9CTJ5_9PEZI|nr:hypothetical protein N0V93_009172 [Gnomoniopsis smithogilvyi]